MRTRPRSIGSEDGYTLIELLVVILVIGILAAIAIPSFLNQTTKAQDASAKELVHAAQIAAETYATDHSGSYAGMNQSSLSAYDATIQTSGNGSAWVENASGSSVGYVITTTTGTAPGADTFTITRLNGTVTRTCTPSVGLHGGCNNGTW